MFTKFYSEENLKSKKTVAVALSGGVDSCAAAYMLKDKGYDVIGITMKPYDSFSVEAAKYTAERLYIDHYVINCEKYFQKEVINYFVNEYLAGKTPNPCIMCNKKIKFGILFEEAMKLGADFFATGHYACVKYDEKDNYYRLYKSKAAEKDQSYYLHHLSQEKLSAIILPLENCINKSYVRSLVKNIVPEISAKRDSFDICFTKGLSYQKFISQKCGLINNNGYFTDIDGNPIEKHNGIHCYTIGQKISLASQKHKTLFITRINAYTKEITLGYDESTYRDHIIVKEMSYTNDKMSNLDSFSCEVKLCQWGYYIKCRVFNYGSTSMVKFEKKERAPAPGQWAVFYDGTEVIGGGRIV